MESRGEILFPGGNLVDEIKGTKRRGKQPITRASEFLNQTERTWRGDKIKGDWQRRCSAWCRPPSKIVNDRLGSNWPGLLHREPISRRDLGRIWGDPWRFARLWSPKPLQHPDDLGDLASALAHEMFSVDLMDRPRRFVGAMAALGAREIDIAEVLHISLRDLKTEFAKELSSR
jgi:hypothetical protein